MYPLTLILPVSSCLLNEASIIAWVFTKDINMKTTIKVFKNFIDFPSSRLELEAVADRFDADKDGYIDYKEFLATLKPSSNAEPNFERIRDEVQRQVSLCKCSKRYHVLQISDRQYRFGDSQKLRLVRILQSTVMVRVGGGWMALDEFLVKNDPCRGRLSL